jgi:hypothetical protein
MECQNKTSSENSSYNQPFVFLHLWKYNLRLKQKFYDEDNFVII